MAIDASALAAAAFMHGAIQYNKPLEDCLQSVCCDEMGVGMDGRVYELIQWAKPLSKLLDALWKSDIDFCGVYHYEVSEPFGEWWARYVIDNKRFPLKSECWDQIAKLAKEFMCPRDDMLTAEEKGVVDYIIATVRRNHSDT